MELEIGRLLAEQRRIGDKFRIVEEAIQQMHRTLAEKHLDTATRSQIEAYAIATTAELMRLGQRQLEIDASVRAANRRAKVQVSD